MPRAPMLFTPKEFASDVLCNRRSAWWVRRQCLAYIRSGGKRGIRVVERSRPYLIPATEAQKFA